MAQVAAIVSAVSGVASGLYKAGVARRSAALERINQENIAFRGQVDQQDKDFAAAQEIGANEAMVSASGFDTTGGTIAARRGLIRTLARSDALRIRHDADVEAWNAGERARGFDAEARAGVRSAFFSVLGGVADFGTATITNANRVASNNLIRTA